MRNVVPIRDPCPGRLVPGYRLTKTVRKTLRIACIGLRTRLGIGRRIPSRILSARLSWAFLRGHERSPDPLRLRFVQDVELRPQRPAAPLDHPALFDQGGHGAVELGGVQVGALEQDPP